MAFGSNSDGQTNVPAGTYTDIAAGAFYSVALRPDGSIAFWGDASNGKASVPTNSTFTQLAAGGFHVLALAATGTMAGWGYNAYGQATARAGSDFVQLSAGAYQSVALRSDGTLVGWGRNNVGQGVAPAGNDYAQISSGGEHNLALKSNGTVVAWGANEYGQSNVPTGMTFRQVAGGGEHSIAIKSDGSLAAWGYDNSGQTDVPSGNKYLEVAGGAFHSMALKVRDSYQDLLIRDISSLTSNDTSLQRNVSVTGNVTIDGTLDWHAVAGELNVGGTVTVNAGSALNLSLEGLDLNHPQAFQFVNDSTPIVGEFDTINLPTPGPHLQWDTSKLYSDGIVQLVPEPASIAGLGIIFFLARRQRGISRTSVLTTRKLHLIGLTIRLRRISFSAFRYSTCLASSLSVLEAISINRGWKSHCMNLLSRDE